MLRRHQYFSAALLLLFASPVGGSTSAAVVAADDASQEAYSDGWQTGDNGGTGFGSWTFLYSGVHTGLLHDPRFIDRAPLSGNSLGAPAFALTTSDRDFFSDTSEVLRTFIAPIAVGQTFSMDVDGSALNPSARAFTTGNTIQLFGPGGQNERFGLFTNNRYLNDTWVATGDVSTGIPAANAFHLAFTVVTPDTYNLTLSPIGGGTPFFTQTGAPLTGVAGTGINLLRISAYGTGSSADGTNELFFKNLMVTTPSLAGDYNNNGWVDAADYVVWRQTLNRTGGGLAADGNGDGRVDASDYSTWRTSFAASSGAAIGAIASVPEPSAFFIVFVAAVFFITQRGSSSLRC
jgi:hypothetical protein